MSRTSRAAASARPVWENRFVAPTWEDLCRGLAHSHAQLIEHAHALIMSLPAVRPVLAWRGIPWRWTATFSVEGAADHALVDGHLAFLIPQPTRPMICVPVPGQVADRLDPRETPRFIRDAIIYAARVGDTSWPHWNLESRTQIEHVIELVRMKLAFLSASPGVLPAPETPAATPSKSPSSRE